jgi:hypothetical protein
LEARRKMENKEEEQKKKIEEQVSQEIPYSKKKCIDLAYEQGRQDKEQELKKEIIEEIDNFSNEDNLKLCWSDFPIECPICKLDNKCWSRISQNPRKEICIYCRIRELKQSIIGSKEKI